MKTVCIHQPDFLPWLGFFDKLTHSDIYIIYDDVQFVRRGWHHRDKIKTEQGVQWLTLPIKKKGKYDQLIKDTKLDNDQPWQKKHLNTLRYAYQKSTCFEQFFTDIQAIYLKKHSFLMDLNIDLIQYFMQVFKISVNCLFSSEVDPVGCKNERLIHLVKAVDGSHYYTGTGSKDYLDEALFKQAGIQVNWQHYQHPVYAQLHGQFIPMLSSVDALFNGIAILDE